MVIDVSLVRLSSAVVIIVYTNGHECGSEGAGTECRCSD